MSFFYVLLAALGLGFLIFIHELGHYWVARRVGIKVEAFSIGFGRAIASWKRDGVEWRIGWLPFGGYVRMAGTDKKGDKQPHEIKGGFFAARPIDRIKVALAGPAVNLLFAFLAFTLLWAMGGRTKSFSEFTHRVGWIDEESELYRDGLRPGDIVLSYDGHPVKQARDHLHAPMLGAKQVQVEGFFVDYPKVTKTPFDLSIQAYRHPMAVDDGIRTLGVMATAQYLIYRRLPDGGINPLPAGSPIAGSGISYGDRLFWADGELLFSADQLGHILAQGKALLTVERNGKQFLRRVQRMPVESLTWSRTDLEELGDWHFASGLVGRADTAYFVPYVLSYDGTVEGRVEAESGEALFPKHPRFTVEEPLEVGDRIVAVDGTPVATAAQMMEALQEHRVHIIVQRKPGSWPLLPWKEADAVFDRDIDWNALAQLAATIGTQEEASQRGNFVLLSPIQPAPLVALQEASGHLAAFNEAMAERREELTRLFKGERLETALAQLEASEQQPRLGIELQDRLVQYNPSPMTLYANVFSETWRTWKALISGYLNPKWLAGPVGIVQVMQYGWAVGFREALFWIAVISLNLGILNLLPIPVLDGGQVCFASYEMISRRRIKAETMEKLVIPFVILLIGFFIFVTYQDLSRLLRGMF